VLAGIGIQFVADVDGRSWHSSKKVNYSPKAPRTDSGSSFSQPRWLDNAVTDRGYQAKPSELLCAHPQWSAPLLQSVQFIGTLKRSNLISQH
jgi:hypothetical protein